MNGRILVVALAGLALVSVADGARAQTADDFPSRPVRIIVAQAAGSGIDLQARVIAHKLGEYWGRQPVVEARAGANGSLAMEAVAKARPDGYMLVYAPVTALAANPAIFKNLSYNPSRDFAPVTQTVANTMGVVVGADSQFKSLKDVIAYAKANPGRLDYGSFGVGNLTHLLGEFLSIAADIKMTHVPYRGQTPAITDVLGGQIPLAFTLTAGVTDLVQSGQLKLLATFGQERDQQFPDTPTPYELGYPSVVMVGWAGLFAPAGTPPQIVHKLHAAVARALASPDVKEAIFKQGSTAMSSQSPEEFARYVQSEADKYRTVIRAAGLENSQ
jgi:tripartite-type tricarboxylate transporter receptor subunit TctC